MLPTTYVDVKGATTASLNPGSEPKGQTADEISSEPIPLSEPGFLGDQIGPYRLVELIGEGGFGEVWRAEQISPVQREVALKVIKLGMDSRQVVARFEAERQALAMMDHPAIARVFDGGMTQAGRPFFVMELVHGTRLTQYCDEKALDLEARLSLFIQVCQAVEHAHQKGIIHRDLKPSNILVMEQDGKAVPKVIDFGIAKATQQSLLERPLATAANEVIGTPAYMSPEQAGLDRLDVDTRSDVYSLGVLFYELMTGDTPLCNARVRKVSLEAVCRAIREEDSPRPSARLGSLPPDQLSTIATRRRAEPTRLAQSLQGDLDWIALKALEKNRNRRYESPAAFAQDVRRFLSHEPVTACPPSRLYRLRKAIRRNRLAFLSASTTLLVLVLALLFSSWSYVGERSALRVANTARALAESRLYSSDLLLSQKSYQDRNLYTAQQLLWAHRNDSNLMGVEYGFLAAMMEEEKQGTTLWTNTTPKRIFESEDASKLLVRYMNGHLELREAPDYRTIWERTNFISVGGFVSHERQVIATDHRETLCWLSATDGSVVRAIPNGGRVIRFLKQQNIIATAGRNFSIRLLDASSSALLEEWPGTTGIGPSDDEPVLTAVSHDGRLGAKISTPPNDDVPWEITVWDFHSKRAIHSWNEDVELTSISFSEDGEQVLLGGVDGLLRIRSLNSAGPRALHLRLHESHIRTIVSSTEAGITLTSGDDQTIRVWETSTWRPLTTLRGHNAAVFAISLTPNGRRLVSGGVEGFVRVWTIPGDILRPTGYQRRISPFSLAFSPDGRRLAVVETNRAVILDTATENALQTLPHHGKVIAHGWSDKGLMTQDETNLVCWDVGRSEVSFTIPLSQMRGPCHASLASRDGNWVATSWPGRRVLVHHLGRRELAFEWSSPRSINQFAFALSRNQLLASDHDNVYFLNLETGKLVNTFNPQQLLMYSLAVPPQENCFVTASGYHRVWDLGNFSLRSQLTGHRELVEHTAFSSDGRTMASASQDGTIKLWNFELAQEVATFRVIPVGEPGERRVIGVALSNDGMTMAGIANDGRLRLWHAKPRPTVHQ